MPEIVNALVDAVPLMASAEEVATSLIPTLPVFETLNSVLVAYAAVDDPMAKSVVGVPRLVEAAKRENSANGEVVPTPTLPTLLTMKSV